MIAIAVIANNNIVTRISTSTTEEMRNELSCKPHTVVLSGQRLIPAMMVVGTPPVGEGEEMVGEVVVCGGVGEGFPGPLTVDIAVLLDGEGSHSAINMCLNRVHIKWRPS